MYSLELLKSNLKSKTSYLIQVEQHRNDIINDLCKYQTQIKEIQDDINNLQLTIEKLSV